MIILFANPTKLNPVTRVVTGIIEIFIWLGMLFGIYWSIEIYFKHFYNASHYHIEECIVTEATTSTHGGGGGRGVYSSSRYGRFVTSDCGDFRIAFNGHTDKNLDELLEGIQLGQKHRIVVGEIQLSPYSRTAYNVELIEEE